MAPSSKAPSSKAPSAKAPSSNLAGGRPCPICGKPPVADYTPFCSKRCADVDLHRWLGGVYAVPTEEEPGDGEMPPPPDRGEP